MPTLFTSFYEQFPEGFIVAEQNQALIGFTIGMPIIKDHARILMLSVKPSYQRQHIGSQLLSALLDVFNQHQLTHITLEVKTDNKKALHFYQQHQFHIVDTIQNFYQNGENAFILKRVFQPE